MSKALGFLLLLWVFLVVVVGFLCALLLLLLLGFFCGGFCVEGFVWFFSKNNFQKHIKIKIDKCLIFAFYLLKQFCFRFIFKM